MSFRKALEGSLDYKKKNSSMTVRVQHFVFRYNRTAWEA